MKSLIRKLRKGVKSSKTRVSKRQAQNENVDQKISKKWTQAKKSLENKTHSISTKNYDRNNNFFELEKIPLENERKQQPLMGLNAFHIRYKRKIQAVCQLSNQLKLQTLLNNF
ncbi:hypothetical protein BpHYR1_009312 [Brachionus plicatilis]|uniref:Uncharacterized protein n=1 Tax=Brachionus plicatilis TaxID=10195 RepID=A0A3M7QJZ8_BRAPC|nr:hypothetical protein BpHYR1_009312 [Brachionus plicatilis]